MSKLSQKTTSLLLIALLVVNVLFAVVPSLYYSLYEEKPFSQYDGAYYYLIAQSWQEGGYHAEVNPIVNVVGKVSEYPPGLVGFYKVLLEHFNADLLIVNGFFIAVLLVLGNIFLFFTIQTLTKDRIIALIVLAYSVLNLRVYYMLFGGIQATMAAYGIGLIALYFFVRSMKSMKSHDIIVAIILHSIMGLVHSATALFIMFIEALLLIGSIVEKRVNIKWPKISANIKKFSWKDLSPALVLAIPFLLLTLGLRYHVSGGGNFLTHWVGTLLKDYAGYPQAWQIFMLFDGPIICTLALISVFYLLYTNKWQPLVVLLGCGVFVSMRSILFPEYSWVVHFILNFYALFFVVMAYAMAHVLRALFASKRFRRLALLLLVVSLFIQIAKLGYFASQLQPAITNDESAAIEWMVDNGYTENMFFYNNIDDSGFRAFVWVMVLSDQRDVTFTHRAHQFEPELDKTHAAIYIGDRSRLSDTERELLYNKVKLFEKGHVTIYQS